MTWEYISDGKRPGWHKYRCTLCGIVHGPTNYQPEEIRHDCRRGPGSQLRRLLRDLGIPPDKCNDKTCVETAREMDALGAVGVRAERERFRQHLLKAYSRLSTLDVAAITARAVASGLAWKLDWTDVPGSLIEEACRLAEEQT